MRGKSRRYLERVIEVQHHQIDGCLRALRTPGNLRDHQRSDSQFRFLSTLLQRRIDIEERYAFPSFEHQTGLKGDGPTRALRHDHREIERRLERISNMLAEAAPASLRAELDALDAILADHSRRELPLLFEAFERILDEPTREESLRILLHG